MEFLDLVDGLRDDRPVRARLAGDGAEVQMRHTLTARQRRVLLAGGFIHYYFKETGRFD